MWIVYSLLSALSNTFVVILSKKVLVKERSVEFALITSLHCAVLSLPLLFFVDFASLPITPLLYAILFSAIPGAIGFYLIARSIRHLEVSIVGPLFILNPAMVAIIAYFFLGEKTTTVQMIGMAILLVGSYVLELNSTHKLLDPIKAFGKSKYIHLMLIALLLYSIGTVYDRHVFVNYEIPVFSYFVLFNIASGFAMSIIYLVIHKSTGGIKNGLANFGSTLLWISLAEMLVRFTMFLAVNAAFVGLATAIRRMSAIFTVIVGGEIFHEDHLFRKTMATGIMVVGAILISI